MTSVSKNSSIAHFCRPRCFVIKSRSGDCQIGSKDTQTAAIVIASKCVGYVCMYDLSFSVMENGQIFML
jgi:hypothetical protein